MTLERWIALAAALGLGTMLVARIRRAARQQESPIDVVTTFLAVWSFSLGLFAIPWIRYSRTSVLAWLAIYGSIACFLLGALAALRRGGSGERVGGRERLSPRHVHMAWLATGLLSLVGFGFFVHATDVTVGWRALIDDPARARIAQNLPQFDSAYGIGKFFSYCGAFSLLLWTVALREQMFKGRSRLLAPLALLVLVPYFFLGERLSLATAVTWIAGFHLVWRGGPSHKNLVRGGVALLVAAIAFFFVIALRKQNTISSERGIRAALTTNTLDQLALPYVYVTANFPEFSRLIQDPIAPTTFGQMTALPITKLVYRVLRVSNAPPKGGAFYPIPFDSYNATTWLDPFYRDFGLLGCLLLPALIGFGSTRVMMLARRRGGFVLGWLAGGALSLIAFSPLKNQLQDAATWEWVILAPPLAMFVRGAPVLERARDLVGSVRRRVPLPALASAGVGAIALVALIVAVRLGAAPATAAQNSSSLLADRITLAAKRALRVYSENVQPTSASLSTQLGVSDPSDTYETIWTSWGMPTRAGWIGVYVGPNQFHLLAFTTSYQTIEVIGVQHGGRYQIVGPRVV